MFSSYIAQKKSKAKHTNTKTKEKQTNITSTLSFFPMAVEAHHLHLFSPQLLKNREFVVDDQSFICNPPPMGFVNADGGYVVPSESGVTVCDTAPRKRSRENFVSFLGEDISSHVHQQMADVDRVVIQHTEKVRLEVMERRRQFMRQVMMAVEERLSKKLKAKDEEMLQICRLNWALEEKVKSLTNENQIWRYLAQTNEATANELRTNLEQVLTEQQQQQQIRVQEEQNFALTAEDAESCCGENCDDGDNHKDDATTTMQDWKRLCRSCSAREPTVMLLPCRHLCLCAKCDPAMDACPICKSFKNGSVHVNLS